MKRYRNVCGDTRASFLKQGCEITAESRSGSPASGTAQCRLSKTNSHTGTFLYLPALILCWVWITSRTGGKTSDPNLTTRPLGPCVTTRPVRSSLGWGVMLATVTKQNTPKPIPCHRKHGVSHRTELLPVTLVTVPSLSLLPHAVSEVCNV